MKKPRTPKGKYESLTQWAAHVLVERPLVGDVMARGVLLLLEEDGIMLEQKFRHLLRKDSDIRSLYSDVNEYYENIGVDVSYAVRYGKVLQYYESVHSNERWFPEVIRIPGVSRTKPKARYLGKGVD